MSNSDNGSNGVFGVNIWWTCPEFVLDGKVAHEILEKHGFEPDDDMPLPSRRNVVSRAAHSFQDRRHKNGRHVTEKAKDNSSCVVYGILGRERKGEDEVGYSQNTTVKLDKESGRVEVNGSLSSEFEKALSRYEDSITDLDIRTFLRKVICLTKGVSKRPSGGIYFVPQQFTSMIEDAQRVLEDLNVGAKLYVERVVNGVQEREIVWDSVEREIGDSIDSTLEAVSRIEKRSNAVNSHEAKLNELNALMEIYRELLGQEAKYEELSERLSSASREVADKLAKLQAEEMGRKVDAPVPSFTRRKRGLTTTLLDDISQVLEDVGKPLHYRELTNEMVSRGIELHETTTNSGEAWVYNTLYGAIRDGDTRFSKIGRGLFVVNK